MVTGMWVKAKERTIAPHIKTILKEVFAKTMEDKDLLLESEIDPQKQREYQLTEIINANYHAEKLREMLSDYHAKDIADILPNLEKAQRLRLYTILSNEELSDIFTYLENPADFTNELSNQKVADIIEEMASDDAVDILEDLDEEKQKEVIELLDEEIARDVELISAYEEDELGSIITNDFVSIKNNFTVKEAMKSVIAQAENCNNITTIYVTDDNGIYCGAIQLKDLFIARADTLLEDIIATSYPCFNANLKIADVLESLQEYSEDSLPVVDGDNRLIGALTDAMLVETTENELKEDYSKLAGISTYTEEKNSLLISLKTRLPWLLILLCLSLGVSAVIGVFDHVVAMLPLLAFFQPMILGMSGNTGTQALGVTIRNLPEATQSKKIRQMFAKEVSLAFINGVFLAVISFLLLGVYVYLFKSMPIDRAFALSACIAVALICSMTVSGFCGCAVPVLFKKLGIDPAAASGPLITTASDLVSAITYYGIVSLIIGYFLI